ncbi:hypothetical protein B0H11DRAFT_2236462 [Mycena galericulata]|nr:hypothetical protein B0H11DRAFT_2236462 [Mycena galericulata]
MAVQTYQPAPNETLGEFVDLLFKRLFFTLNDFLLVLSTFENDVATDVVIEVNGKSFPPGDFLEVIKEFHATSIGNLTKIDDLAMSPFDAAARTGVDGSVKEQVSVTIVKVEEKDGKRIMTSLVEVQA